MALINVHLVDRYLRITTHSLWFLYTYLVRYVTLKSTKTHWSKMYIFIHTKKIGFTSTILHYSPLQEKCGLCGNQTVQQGARSYKKMENFKSFKREINPFCYIMLFLQWMIFYHFEHMWIVNV